MFVKHINGRVKLMLVGSLFLFILVGLRVFYLQTFAYERLNTLASALWCRNLPIEANRGLIYDRHGVIIADNITTTSLILIPNQIKDKELVSRELARILQVSETEMARHVNQRVSIERVHPEGRRLDYEIADKINALNFDGVYLVKEAKRHYPYDDYLAHVLGFVGIDNQGLSGLELQYDNYLTGANGAIKYFADAKGERLKLAEIYEQPQPGINLMLTIDHKIQLAVERELNNIVTKYHPDSALILVMDPRTGEILGMGSRPNFSPNHYQKYSVEVINRNLPIWATYEPGSTFKIITLASAIEEKLVDLKEDTFYDTGAVRVENARIRCWKAGGHGHQTFLEVVENSCNPGFVELGQRLGKEKLFAYINKFGFGQKTGIDLNGEGNGIIFNLEQVGPVELATTSFGQGVSVTPIQQVTAVSAAINGGYLYQPYIVKRLLEPMTNDIIKEHLPQQGQKVISDATSKEVRMALESVVAKGTGRPAYLDGYRVGGKTGTAQKVKHGVYMVGNYILSFIGFLPSDSPEVVVYVAIDHPRGVVQYGGVVAGPVAKAILRDCVTALKIEQRDGGPEYEYNWLDPKKAIVPDVIGLTKKEASTSLKSFQIEWTGNGKKIIEQAPSPGERLEVGAKVRLLLGEN